MKLVKDLSYRQWQQRNTSAFKALSKEVQKELRTKGYYNVSWEKVKKSWELISKSKIVNLIDYKLKSGDLNGAINLVDIESENVNKLASKTLGNIQQKRQQLDLLMANTISKYSKI